MLVIFPSSRLTAGLGRRENWFAFLRALLMERAAAGGRTAEWQGHSRPDSEACRGETWPWSRLRVPFQEQLGVPLTSNGKPCKNDKRWLQLMSQPARTLRADLFPRLREEECKYLRKNLSLQNSFCKTVNI